MRYIAATTAQPIRFVGLSTALANAADLADWLGIGKKVLDTSALCTCIMRMSSAGQGLLNFQGSFCEAARSATSAPVGV